MSEAITLGIIGGSGLYSMPELQRLEEQRLSTAFGDPSDAVMSGYIGEHRLLFLPRHGRGHRIPPHRINYRANILALKELGADAIVSVSAVGSMREAIKPGHFVLVDQFIDRTRSRPSTFFDEGVVCHVEFAEPIDAAMHDALGKSAKALALEVHAQGTYICIEGPQFSTKAESHVYRSWGADVIGMTNLPEARLAREAEIPYATVALATDYDCWKEHEKAVTVDSVVAIIKQNVSNAQRLIVELLNHLPAKRELQGKYSIKNSILSDLSMVEESHKKRLASLIGNYI